MQAGRKERGLGDSKLTPPPPSSSAWSLPHPGTPARPLALGLHPGCPVPPHRAMSGAADTGGEGDHVQEQGHAGRPAQQHLPRVPRVGFGQEGGQRDPPCYLLAGGGGAGHVLKQPFPQHRWTAGTSSPFPTLTPTILKLGGGGRFPHHPPQRAGPGARQRSLSWATPCSSHIGEPGTRLSGPPSHRSRDGLDGVLQRSAPCGPRSWGLAARLAQGRGNPGRIPGGAGGRVGVQRRGAKPPAQPPRPTV